MSTANPTNDQMAEQLDRQFEHWGPDFFWHRVRWKAVREQLPATGSFGLVDVGAGSGFVGEYLSRDRPSAAYSFIEPLPTLEKRLEARWGTEANLKEANSFGDSHFVCTLDVLEHIEDDEAFLSDLAQKMSPGAKLIILVPALQSLWTQWDVELGHFRRYDKGMIESLAADLPFKITEQAYLFPEMLPAAWLRKRRGNRGGELADPNNPPAISSTLNRALFAVASATEAVKRFTPRGTSLLAVLEKS